MGKESREHYVFLSGAISGVIEGVTIQPLEMLKTRFQINTGEPLRIIPTIKEIIKEGGVLQLYRGGLPEITGGDMHAMHHAWLAHAASCASMQAT